MEGLMSTYDSKHIKYFAEHITSQVCTKAPLPSPMSIPSPTKNFINTSYQHCTAQTYIPIPVCPTLHSQK